MKSLLLFLTAASTVGSRQAQGQFVCDIPTAGCTNGMFNQGLCECECIPPFCLDGNGDCTSPSNNCGGNKWAACTRGVNCPWWINPLKAESCTTGGTVPIGLWSIFSTKQACCNTNFPYSDFCDVKKESPGPTKHPTIAAPEDDIYEVIPIKFDVSGLPDSITMRDLKEEMAIVLKRILLRLAKSIPGLKVSSVEEKVVIDRNLENAPRALKKDVSLYFNVYVIRDDDRKFGPLIISEIQDSYNEVLDQIQTFADTKYFSADLQLNWCTSQNGKFELCVKEIINKPVPRVPAGAPTSILAQSDPPAEDKGFPTWAIVLIVIILLLLICCIGYFIFASCKNDEESNGIHNNIYMDDRRGRDDTYFVDEEDRSRQTRNPRRTRSRPSRHTNDEEVQIVLAEPQDPSFDDDSFTINTYGTKKKRQSRDPTMYILGQEDRPDPECLDEGEEGSRRLYLEDPPLKPKRDPTMYVEGQGDASMYSERNYTEDPPLKPKREPTMYVDGQKSAATFGDGASQAEFSVGRGASVGGFSGDPYGMGGIDGDEYDDYVFNENEYTENVEHAHGARDPTYYSEEGDSFRTEEPSVSRSSKKKSKKSKKSSRSAK